MTKKDMIEAIAKDTKLSKADAERAYSAVFANIEKALKKDKSFNVSGFGTFKLSKRAARTGRNPQTGAAVKIPARWAVTFKAGTALKAKFNK